MTAYNFQQLIDFTRTSSATFVGSNGLIQNTPASVNLLTWTQEFDNAAWVKSNATITANSTTAPDGTMTADLQTISAQFGGASQFISNLTSGATYKVSFWAKVDSGTRTYTVVDNSGGGGILGTYTPTTSWVRYEFTLTAGSTSATMFIAQDRAASGFGSVFIWGAQLEAGSTATAYTRNVGGRFPARFDYDPVTLAPRGILIEEQRTNLLTYSEDITSAAWLMLGTAGASRTANATTAPDGTSSADRYTVGTGSGAWYIANYANPNITSGQAYTFSTYVKANGLNFVFVRPHNNSVNFGASGFIVSLIDGTITYPSTPIAPVSTGTATNVGNGWWRITATSTANATVTPAGGGPGIWPCNSANIALATGSGLANFTGDGTSGIFIWGAQFEVGAFATSYIPTVASQVTRTADQASIVAPMFAPWYNQTEGTFVVRYLAAIDAAGTYRTQIKTDNAGSTNYIQIRNANLAPTTAITNSQVAQGVTQADMSSATLVGGAAVRIALAYKVNNFAAVTNGATPVTDVSGTVPSDLIALTFGGGTYAVGQTWFSSITYYPVRLLDTQLQALTA